MFQHISQLFDRHMITWVFQILFIFLEFQSAVAVMIHYSTDQPQVQFVRRKKNKSRKEKSDKSEEENKLLDVILEEIGEEEENETKIL